MNFKMEPYQTLTNQKLSYNSEEYSFEIQPITSEIDFDIVLNYLILMVVEGNIIGVSGFCPYGTWIQSHHPIPKFAKGILTVVDSLAPGFSYRLNDVDWQIYVNVSAGWVCVGNPIASGEGIEFMNNCVAIISDRQLVALWLKPTELPTL